METNATTDLFTYIQWRGDLLFSQAPFCPVDNLIFCCLSYLNWDGIAEGRTDKDAISLSQAAALWNAQDVSHQQVRTTMDRDLLHAVAESDRFKNVRLFRYEARYREEQQEQFSAISFLLDPDTVYVAYRGTDNTLIGWREDFNLSFLPQVPSQKTAADYLHSLLEMNFSNVIVGGHSKGGNLAVFAAVHTLPIYLSKLKAVYNNDGPGFSNGLWQEAQSLQLQERIHTFVPQASVVGMLLEHDEDYRVVYSKQKGFLQHDPYSWCVIRNDWYYLQDVTSASKLMDGTLKSWILGMQPEERERLTDTIFHVLQSETNAKTLQELRDGGYSTVTSILRAWNDTPLQTRRFMQKMLLELLLTARDLISIQHHTQSPEKAYAQIQNRRRETTEIV